MVQRLTWLVPLVLLQGCAGTPLADRLETSFGVPETIVETPSARSEEATSMGSKREDSASPAADRSDLDDSDGELDQGNAPSIAPTASVPAPSPESPSNPTNPTRANPTQSNSPSSNQPQEPYRITIRLSGADPAAPAEAVTRVLRNADVSFAVERIERIQP
jgi:hypothetical protein